jgi:hypothetical protein
MVLVRPRKAVSRRVAARQIGRSASAVRSAHRSKRHVTGERVALLHMLNMPLRETVRVPQDAVKQPDHLPD